MLTTLGAPNLLPDSRRLHSDWLTACGTCKMHFFTYPLRSVFRAGASHLGNYQMLPALRAPHLLTTGFHIHGKRLAASETLEMHFVANHLRSPLIPSTRLYRDG